MSCTFLKICSSPSVFAIGSTFIKKCGTPASFCIWVASSSRNGQLVIVFHTSCTSLKKHTAIIPFCNELRFLRICAPGSYFLYELQFSQERCNSNRFLVRVSLLSINVQHQSVSCWYELHFSQDMCKLPNIFSKRVALFLRHVQLQPILSMNCFPKQCPTNFWCSRLFK